MIIIIIIIVAGLELWEQVCETTNHRLIASYYIRNVSCLQFATYTMWIKVITDIVRMLSNNRPCTQCHNNY